MNALVQCFEEARVIPFSLDRYACYDKNNNLIKDSLNIRSYGITFLPAPPAANYVYNDAEIIFAGFLFPHYGHFLLESLARLWYAKEHQELPICFIGRNQKIFELQQEILHLLGINNTLYIVDQAVIFKKLIVPRPGCVIRQYIYPFQIKFLGQYATHSSSTPAKIFLSRARFSGNSILSNDEQLETELAKLGYAIIYPEQLPISTQLELLFNAKIILALEGSALHNLLLLKEVQAQVLIIPRPAQEINQNYAMIADAKGFRQCYFPFQDLYANITKVQNQKFAYNYQARINIDLLMSYLKHFETVEQADTYTFYTDLFLHKPNLCNYDPDFRVTSTTILQNQYADLLDKNMLLKQKLIKQAAENSKLKKLLVKSHLTCK